MTLARAGVPISENQQAGGSKARQIVLVLLISAIILSPDFTIRSGFYKPRGEDFILATVLAFWALSLMVERTGTKWFVYSGDDALYTRIMLGMIYVAVISIGVGTIAFQQRLIVNDVMILPMLARYLLIFLIGQWARKKTEQRVFIWALVGSLGVSALVGILQHFNLFGINDWLTPHYVADFMQVLGLEWVKLGLPGSRVVGTHGDPREYGYILVVGMGVCLSIYMNLRQGLIRWIAVVVLGLCLMAISYTLSRTAFLSSGVVFLAAILFLRRGNRRVSQIIGPLIVLLIVIALIFPAYESQSFTERVLTLGTASYDLSLGARIRDLTQPFRLALESPIIWLTGRGPSKADVRTDAHGDIGWYFYRFGLPGLLLYLSLIISGLKFSWRAWAKAADPLGRTMSMAAFLLAVNWLVFIMAENIVKDPQIMALNMLLIGAGLAWPKQE